MTQDVREQASHQHVPGEGFGSSITCARRAFLASLDELELPEQVTTCYGERVSVGRHLEWLLDQDQPTLTVLAALIDAARDEEREL